MRALVTAAALALAVRPAFADDAGGVDTSTGKDAAAAQSAGLPEPAANVAAKESAREEAAHSNAWGLAIDAGLPEGAAVSLAFRPVPKIRFWAGPAWNYVSWGLQGGITAVVMRSVITPIISAEGGRYFKTDVSFLARNSQGVPEELKPLLANMGSWYAAAHVGVEAGNPRGLSMSLRAGISYMVLDSRGTATFTDQGTGVVVTMTNPRVRGAMPSLKLGVQYWF